MGEGYRYIGLGKSLKGTITLREDEETRPKKKKEFSDSLWGRATLREGRLIQRGLDLRQ